MKHVTEKVIDTNFLSRLKVAELLSLKDQLEEGTGYLETIIEGARKKKDPVAIKKHRDELFFVMANLANIDDALLEKVSNVFEITVYSQICYN